MALKRQFPMITHRTVFWAVFGGLFGLLALAVVQGLKPTVTLTLTPSPSLQAIEARSGRMTLPGEGQDCRQVSFNNETAEITGTRAVPCAGRPKGLSGPSPAATKFGGPGTAGLLGSMRKAFKGAGEAEPQ